VSYHHQSPLRYFDILDKTNYTYIKMSNISLPHGVVMNGHGGAGSRKQHNKSFRYNSNNNNNNGGMFRSTSTLFVMILTAVPSFLLGSVTTFLFLDGLQPPPNQRVVGAGDATTADCDTTSSTTNHYLDDHHQFLFPEDAMGRFATAMARVTKQEFTNALDLGVPTEASTPGAEDVVIVYANSKAMPNDFTKTQQTSRSPIPHLSSIEHALEHCDFLNVILTDHGRRRQCLAIVPQYESYHIQKWMRIQPKTGKLQPEQPLTMVSRGQQANGKDNFDPPSIKDKRKHWELLQQYWNSLDDVLEELKIILQKIAIHNTVIVMVCNFGQSELLMNFVCAAKRRNLNLSNLIVFTTDPETTDMVQKLGIAAYYDHRNFGNIPIQAAQRYGDTRFVAMMMAKVICVQLVSMLGYDFLFQDVDIIWYQNPLEYFANASIEFDAFFQDDGAHSVRYAPYSANSGFYYVRHNAKTRHFLSSLLMAGDLVLATDSHQQAMIATLNEHVSLYGLRVKVLSRDRPEFPGGYQYHQKSGNYMRSVFAGQIYPIIFHMSWTKNKDNKLLFFRQMGEWYVSDQCIAKSVDQIRMEVEEDLSTACCSAEPLFSCHYRDKPSIRPCKDSPPIDKGGPSWWK
jgi:hypothetical protein